MAISYGKQFISDEDIKAVTEVLKGDFLTQGPKIAEFEELFARYVGAKYAVAVANGTAALHLCAIALDVTPGGRWITSPITFAASANCIGYCGGSIEFCDIDPESFLLDLRKLENMLSKVPVGTYKGIIPVDFAGHACDMEMLQNLAEKYELKIIEDACHAPGGYFTDSSGAKQYCGNANYADLAIFSFHPVKHIATGEGGMITTNDSSLYQKLLLYRTHGITKQEDLLLENHGGWYYEMQELGYNYRLSDIQAALGVSQMSRAKEGVERRNTIAQTYNSALKGIGDLITPVVKTGVYHAYHLYVIQTEKRKDLYEFLRKKQIFCQVHYIPVHLMPYYRKLGWKKGDMPVAEAYYERCLSLPMYPTLSDSDLEYVIDSIKEFYR